MPVTPRKQANKQGGPTPPSSLMSPGDEPWRRPGFQPEFASPLPEGSQAGCFLKAPVSSSARGRDRPGLNSEPTAHVCPGLETAPFSPPASLHSFPGFTQTSASLLRAQTQPGRRLQSDGLIALFWLLCFLFVPVSSKSPALHPHHTPCFLQKHPHACFSL